MAVIGTLTGQIPQEYKDITPDVTQVEGKSVLQKSRALTVVQGQTARLQWTMTDQQGKPVDLTDYGFSVGSSSSSSSGVTAEETIFLTARLREALSFTAQNTPIILTPGVSDAVGGKIYIQFTRNSVACPGVYILEIALTDDQQNVIFSNRVYLNVERGQYGATISNSGPPTIPEIRLHLRDNAPEDNYLLDEFEFDLAEIVACIERPILYFNDSQPPVNTRYTTTNFPWRYLWLEGIVSCLYRISAHHYRRNRLQYSAAGQTGIDDKNKSQEYEAKAEQLWQEFKRQIQLKKTQLNAEMAFGSTGGAGFHGLDA